MIGLANVRKWQIGLKSAFKVLISICHTRVSYCGFSFDVTACALYLYVFTILWFVTPYGFRVKIYRSFGYLLSIAYSYALKMEATRFFSPKKNFGLFVHTTVRLIPVHCGYYRHRRRNLNFAYVTVFASRNIYLMWRWKFQKNLLRNL
jgi:hypothetical protein